ncbi:MAG: hypothetical protein RR333_07090 [Bacteroidales bacterium]
MRKKIFQYIGLLALISAMLVRLGCSESIAFPTYSCSQSSSHSHSKFSLQSLFTNWGSFISDLNKIQPFQAELIGSENNANSNGQTPTRPIKVFFSNRAHIEIAPCFLLSSFLNYVINFDRNYILRKVCILRI